MLGVKIFLLVFVISFVWHVITQAVLKNSDAKTLLKVKDTKEIGPWWFFLDGFLILVDLFGLVYIAVYFLFVYFR